MKLIKSECCVWSTIYGRLELIFVYCCCHHSSLSLRNEDGTANILHNRKGVTQEDPLDMVAYEIGLLQLIKILKSENLDVTSPW